MNRTCIALLLVVALLAACGPQEAETPPDEVTVQLSWYHQAEFAGFYAADQQGFYAGENIDVTFKAGGPDIPPETIVSDVIRGDSTFAIVGADTVLAARYRDEPVVAIAVVFQRNPQCYAVLKNSGIERPRDLMGKKVMVPLNGLIQHEALLEKMDIDLDSVEVIPYEYDVTPLCTRQVDAHQLNRTTLGLLLEEKGCEPNFIWIDDYGVRFYADTIVTSDEFVQNNPGNRSGGNPLADFKQISNVPLTLH
jgi:NitT/TauT family transport system substrate-binding protein